MPISATHTVANVRRAAPWAAWGFIIVSLLHLAWVAQAKLASPSGDVSLFRVVRNDVSHEAWGLNYDGWLGLGWVAVQGLAIGAAALATALPIFGRKWRRIGHVALVSWAALWWGNFLKLAMVDPGVDSVGRAAVMTALLVAMMHRGARGWRGRTEALPGTEPIEAKMQANAAPSSPTAERVRAMFDSAAAKISPAAQQGAQTLGKGLGKAGDVVIGWSEKISSPARVSGAVRKVRGAVSASAGFASRQLARLAEASRPASTTQRAA